MAGTPYSWLIPAMISSSSAWLMTVTFSLADIGGKVEILSLLSSLPAAKPAWLTKYIF